MLILYLIATIIGGGLVLLSALGGLGHDIDHDLGLDDADLHVDTDKPGDMLHEAGFWLPFFSLRFWTYAIAGFGVFGLFLTVTNFAPEPSATVIAAVFGIVAGTVAALIMRWFRVNELDSAVRDNDMLGKTATVTVAPRNGEPGKVRMSVKGDLIDLLALPLGDVQLEKGDEVVVVDNEGVRVVVSRPDDYLKELN